MARVFITFRRTDIPNGVLVIQDLAPNVFTRDVTYTSLPQGPYYVRQPVSQPVVTVGTTAISVPAATQGLAAYLISHVEAGGTGTAAGALTAGDATTIANALLTRARTGAAMELTNINTVISATTADSELTNAGGSNSTGAVADVLAIIAGKKFTLPAGTVVQSNTNVFAGMSPTATAAAFDEGSFRTLYGTNEFMLSAAGGNIAAYSAANFTYNGIVGAAIAAYNEDGSVYVP